MRVIVKSYMVTNKKKNSNVRVPKSEGLFVRVLDIIHSTLPSLVFLLFVILHTYSTFFGSTSFFRAKIDFSFSLKSSTALLPLKLYLCVWKKGK